MRDAQEQFPNKRIIAHFLQPHTPFLGETAKKIRNEAGRIIDGGYHIGQFVQGHYEKSDLEDLFASSDYGTFSYQEFLSHTEYGRECVLEAYRETLDIALQEVRELITDLDGKTILTADHGECFDERLFPLGPVCGTTRDGLVWTSYARSLGSSFKRLLVGV